MRIKEITASNFKLAGFSHNLEPVTVFVGANGTGKSAVPESILLGALGTIPGGRYSQVRAIYERYAPDQTVPMSVQMIMKNGAEDYIELNREIKLASGGTKITQEVHFRGEKGGAKKMQALIDPALGLTAEVIDFSIFEGMSPAEQKRFLFSLVSDPEGFDREEIRKQISDVLLKTAAPEPEVEGLEWRDEEFGIELMPIVENIMKGWDSTSSITENLVRIDSIARDMKSMAVQKRKDLTAQIKGAAMQAPDERPKINLPLGELRKKCEELQTREKELIGEIEREKARAANHKYWYTDNKVFQVNLEQAQDRLAKVQEEERDAKIDEKIIQKKSATHSEDWFEKQGQEWGHLEKELKSCDERALEARKAVDAADIELDRVAQIKDLVCRATPICPLTKEVCGDKWDHEEWKQKIVDAEKNLAAKEYDLNKRVELLDQAEKDKGEHESVIRIARSSEASLHNDIKVLESRKKNLAGAVAQWQEAVESAQAQYDRHLENDARIVADDKTAELETEQNEVEKLIVDHKSSLSILEKRNAAEANRLKFQYDQIEAQEMETLTSALVKKTGPAGILGDALRASLSPVVDEINNFLPDGYGIEITPAGGDLSVLFSKEGESARSFNAISTGEMSILATVCAIVFMNRKGAKLRLLIIDRMESIYIDQREMLMKTIVTALADGHLDNFIGGYVGDPEGFGEIEGVNVVHLHE